MPPPNQKRVSHPHAVKAYERAAGDKTLPSDLRPPHILKKTLDYLFGTLVRKEGFKETFGFVRDRTRSVRNDFTMQHERASVAIECHERCARFHVVALHEMRGTRDFEVFLEEQQLMNTLQSLKEFYTDPINADNPPPNQLEFRVYHRLIHIRDQKERHDDVPKEILDHPIFRLVTRFRHAVQATSSPITKSSKLRVDEQGMRIFGELVGALMQGNSSSTESNRTSKVMPYLVACILQHLFGSETIDEAEMETIRGGLDVVEIIDGGMSEASEVRGETNGDDDMGEAFMGEVEDEGDQLDEGEEDLYEYQEHEQERHTAVPAFSASQASAPAPTVGSAFSNLTLQHQQQEDQPSPI
ncbi:hypothetical protein BT96DRAFT_821581 [Gymnopus androsaceus JB14]|uniref:SAC3/GANP/THP3 conserved domain-containing protein n=1 Tax=Gymnopus androsaceus JB14 TaxID=1447944 RepID=A0A6A4HIS2_9AGAR|nr:hypothetical protein BT96DRAFT_821581 [Gymnopus androsaceus JB14]